MSNWSIHLFLLLLLRIRCPYLIWRCSYFFSSEMCLNIVSSNTTPRPLIFPFWTPTSGLDLFIESSALTTLSYFLSSHLFILHARWLSGKEPTCWCRTQKRCGLDPWVGEIPWRRAWQPTQGFLPGESNGQRSLVGYGPKGHKESDMTEGI